VEPYDTKIIIIEPPAKAIIQAESCFDLEAENRWAAMARMPSNTSIDKPPEMDFSALNSW